MDKVFFNPWIGENYESGGMFGKKILVVGEAHICGADCPECGLEKSEGCEELNTPQVVNHYLTNHSGEWSRTFRKFERALVGESTDDNQSEKIWNSIAFYNYIQRAMTMSRLAPTREDCENGETAFFEVIDRLKPDSIIVWGKRLYDAMPYTKWTKNDSICINDTVGRNGFYQNSAGKNIPTLCINHPSSAFSWEKWHDIINQFLNSDESKLK